MSSLAITREEEEAFRALQLPLELPPKNTSGLAPLGRAVLVEHYVPERKSSVIVMPDNVDSRVLMVEQRATVIECGPACWPDEPPRAKPGDRVLVARMSGYEAIGPADGKRYRLVNDRDIFCRIEVEA